MRLQVDPEACGIVNGETAQVLIDPQVAGRSDQMPLEPGIGRHTAIQSNGGRVAAGRVHGVQGLQNQPARAVGNQGRAPPAGIDDARSATLKPLHPQGEGRMIDRAIAGQEEAEGHDGRQAQPAPPRVASGQQPGYGSGALPPHPPPPPHPQQGQEQGDPGVGLRGTRPLGQGRGRLPGEGGPGLAAQGATPAGEVWRRGEPTIAPGETPFGGSAPRVHRRGDPLAAPSGCAYNFLYMPDHQGKPMDAITYTAARANLARTMDRVCEDHDPIIITRNSEQAVVMLSLEDYSALTETAYLLRSPANALRLLESVAELEQGGGTARELTE